MAKKKAKKVSRKTTKKPVRQKKRVPAKTEPSLITTVKVKVKKNEDFLPVITKGGVEVLLSDEQREKLKYTIKAYGKYSVEVKELMMKYANDSVQNKKGDTATAMGKIMLRRVPSLKPGKIRQNSPAPEGQKQKKTVNPKPKNSLGIAVKNIIDIIVLAQKRDEIVQMKINSVQKKKYEKAAHLKVKEEGYDVKISTAVSELRKVRKFL